MQLWKPEITLVVAEDNDDDWHLLTRAFEAAGLREGLVRARDGMELLELLEKFRAEDGKGLPRAYLILLDINMPRMDGKMALMKLRSDPHMAVIPTLMLTTSDFREEIMDCYRMGANAVFMKPLGFDDFVELVRLIKACWLDRTVIPPHFN